MSVPFQAFGPPPMPTLLQVQCGTCHKLVNVPANAMIKLLVDKQYTCPHCQSLQSINLAPQQETQLRMQAEHWMRALALASMQHMPRPPAPPQEEPSLDEVDDADEAEVRDTFMDYVPSKLRFGDPHPDPVVETASLAAVDPPDISYTLAAQEELVTGGRVSALQLEAVVYACQRHEQRLPDGARGGFFIGDGAGVGKGRTIAALILENWKLGRHRHLWISVGSDLKFDARRDLNDVGAEHIPLHALNKLPYSKLAGAKVGVKQGVMFLTYSSLISSSDRGVTRFKQLVEWCEGKDFDGLIVFDESHKAKNLVPEAGSRSTQVGLRVKDIQTELPSARIVYCSATGASEPRNMGYMVRLGLWGEGNPAFPDFGRFLDAVQTKSGGSGAGSMAALELVAMDMKAAGMYVCRTLSFAGAEFQTLEAPLEEPIKSQYSAAAQMWNELFREFLFAEEQREAAMEAAEDAAPPWAAGLAEGGAPSGSTAGAGANSGRRRGGFGGAASVTWRSFWASHQRFFRHMCMAAKVPEAVRMAEAALAAGKCVVIGLQSTGEARTADVIAEKGSNELEDFVSGPKELLLRLVEDYYPLPPDPVEEDASASSGSDGDGEFNVESVTEEVAKGRVEGRPSAHRGSKSVEVRYKEYGSDEDIGNTSSDDESEDSEDGVSSSDSGSGSDAGDSKEGTGGELGSSSASSGADSDFDPTAAAAARREGRSRSEGSLDTQQRAQEAMLAEIKAMRREQLAAARRTALERKTRVMTAVENLELPPNPLDYLIHCLGGPPAVAEMTGRKGRLVRIDPGNDDNTKVQYQPRNASGMEAGASTLEMINVHERGLFQDDKKLVAVISEAASAGISLHADRRAKNQRRRVHITLELPWSADKAIQQFGRSHRANQAHGPEYRLVFTPLGGERRFAAAVARRLESLGALTQGDRRAGPSLAAFNYESSWGQKALREAYGAILEERSPPMVVPAECRPPALGDPEDRPPPIPLAQWLGRTRAHLLNAGIIRHNRAVVSSLHINQYLDSPDGAPRACGAIEERDRADVPRFLNRLLGLAPSAQASIFDYFQATLDELTERGRRAGTLDEGIVDLKAQTIKLAGPPRTLVSDASQGPPTVLYTILLDRGLPWEDAAALLEQYRAQEVLQAGLGAETVLESRPMAAADADAEAGVEGDAAQEASPAEAAEPEAGQGEEEAALLASGKRGREAANGEESGAAEGQERLLAGTQEPSPAGEGRARKRRKAPAGATSPKTANGDGEDVIDLTADDDGDEPAGGGAAAAKADSKWVSGFYRARQESGGRIHVLLALQVPQSKPPTFAIHRPGTGRTRQTLALHELRSRYLPLTPAKCKALWLDAFTAAGSPYKDGRPGLRRKTVHVLGGAVLRCWGTVQRALVRHVKSSERRMRVLRISTTAEAGAEPGGEGESQRLVGMLLPESAVEDVVAELTGQATRQQQQAQQGQQAFQPRQVALQPKPDPKPASEPQPAPVPKSEPQPEPLETEPEPEAQPEQSGRAGRTRSGKAAK